MTRSSLAPAFVVTVVSVALSACGGTVETGSPGTASQQCDEAAPEAGMICDAEGLSCRSGPRCDPIALECQEGVWREQPVDPSGDAACRCPDEPPQSSSSCLNVGLICGYEEPDGCLAEWECTDEGFVRLVTGCNPPAP